MANQKVDSQHESTLERKEEFCSSPDDNKSLKYAYEMILNYGYQEHKAICIDRQKIQFDYIKLYATLSSIIIGAILSAASFFELKEKIILPKNIMQSCYLSVLLVSIGICLFVFIVAIGLLRGKAKTPFPFGGIGKTFDWVNGNYKLYTEKELFELELLKSFVSSVTQSFEDSLQDIERIGTWLNILSRLLRLGILFAFLGISFAYYDFVGITLEKLMDIFTFSSN